VHKEEPILEVIRDFLKDSSTLRDRAFFHNLAYIFEESDRIFMKIFTTDVSLDIEVLMKFWK